jgi:FkbM family methyltransferase
MNAQQTWREARNLGQAILDHPSTKLQKAGIAWRIAARQLHKRLIRRPLWVRWENLWLQVHTNATSAATAYYFGRPDHWEFAFLERFLRPGDHVVDVGANVGVYSLFFAKLVGARGLVLACEPDPQNRERLAVNLARNGFAQVRIVPTAVGERRERLRFRSGADAISQLSETGDLEVEVAPLDELCSGMVPRLVKVDVEGHEISVLRGAQRLLRADTPPTWLLEITPGGPGHSRRELIDMLQSEKYGFYDFDEVAGKLRTADPERPKGNNLLAVHDSMT